MVLGFVMNGGFQTFMEPVTGHVEHHEPVIPVIAIQVATVSLAVLGAVVAYLMYARQRVPMTAPAAGPLVVAARNDLYQDAVNESLFMRPGMALTRTLNATDEYIVDGVAEGTAFGLRDIGKWISKAQNGFVRSYASYVVAGAALAVLAVLFTRM